MKNEVDKMIIKNYDETLENLIKMIKEININRPECPIDIYMYLDEDGNAELHKYWNVGGRSWIDDDHITLYRIEGGWEQSPEEEVLEEEGIERLSTITGTDLSKFAEDDDLDVYEFNREIIRVLREHPDLLEKVRSYWADDYIEADNQGYFYTLAESILNEYKAE